MTAIRSIACALPELELTNAELGRANPAWDMERVATRAGVLSRRVAASGETAFDLSARACEALVEDGLDIGKLDAILYCTQSPDYLIPGNAHLLHGHLDLRDDVLALDFALGCSGFVYGLAMADSYARSGLASEMLLVNAETMSKRINPRDRAVATLFGDAAAVIHISSDDSAGGRIVASRLCAHGQALERVYVPGGAARRPSSEETRRETVDRNGNVRSLEDMRMNGPAVWAFVNATVPGHVKGFLDSQGLRIDDIDLWVFHQASKIVLDSLTRALGIAEDRVESSFAEVGNVSSASIPIALRTVLDEGRVAPGSRVLLCAFGAGMSYGSVLVEY